MNYRDTLEDLEQRLNLDREFDSMERFVIGVCRSLDLSTVAHAALEIAARYIPRWTPQIRPWMDRSKPATRRGSETGDFYPAATS
jgi:hypothetical protein